MKAIVPALVIILIASVVSGRAARDGDGEPPDAAGAAGAAASPAAERPMRWFGRSACTLTAEPPIRDRRNDRILGPARYRCDRPGAEVEFTLYLQRRGTGSAWTTIDSRPVAVSGAATTRDRSDRQRTVSIVGACVEGAYRTFLRGTVTVGGTSTAVEHVSSTVTDPCGSARAR
jgi:hypothetical protein